MTSDSVVSISVVVPVYSGEAFLFDLVEQLDALRTDWHAHCFPIELSEVILVDDAAVDGSPAVIDQLAAAHTWVTAIHLMRNFGQHAATIAGVLHSSGDWVITMDEDLQHPPLEIENLLRHAVEAESDVVYAKPASAVHEAPSRDWASRSVKKLMVYLTGNTNIAHFNSFRLLRGSLARAASSVCGHETYFDVALSWFTDRVGVRPLELKDRRFISTGQSGYSLYRLLSHARRLFISSRVRVIRAFGLVGMGVVIISMVGGLTVLLAKIFFPDAIGVTGWASLMLANLFFGGFLSCMVALVLEYLSTLVQASHGKPIFFTVDRSSDARLAAFFASRLK